MLAQTPRDEREVQRRADQWQGELQQVEGVLRRLVADATSASQSLDRQLSRRHEELAALARRIDQHNTEQNVRLNPELLAIANENAVSAAAPQSLLDDLPNPTWLKSSKPAVSQKAKNKHTEQFDTENQARAIEPLPGLSSEIEVEKQLESPPPSSHEAIIAALPSALGVSMLSNTDIAAYRVAARLLANGKEIHVVARKLGLPIHEIRGLDLLLRGETQVKDESSAAAYEETASKQPRHYAQLATEDSWTLGDEETDNERLNPIFSREVSLL